MLRDVFHKPAKTLMKWKITPCRGVTGVELQPPSRQWQKSPKHQPGLHVKLSENLQSLSTLWTVRIVTVPGFKDTFKARWSAALCQILALAIVTLPGAAERAERGQSPGESPARREKADCEMEVSGTTDPAAPQDFSPAVVSEAPARIVSWGKQSPRLPVPRGHQRDISQRTVLLSLLLFL